MIRQTEPKSELASSLADSLRLKDEFFENMAKSFHMSFSRREESRVANQENTALKRIPD